MQGRASECRTLDGLLASVRASRSATLVLRGDAGVGKTALLDYLRDQASGCRVARAVGVQAEMELPFAGLHQLCLPMLARLECLPVPQRDALATAFGLSAGTPPDRFLVGLAVLTLLADAAAAQPLVCLVDDAQWLDRASAQALAFAARRLLAESVALVFAVRTEGEYPDLPGLPELDVEGLNDADARALLGNALSGPLDERVRDRIVAETHGNPLALLELPRALTPAELAGGFGASDGPALSERIEESFRRRLATLAPETQQLLRIAAAEPSGDARLVWRAAERLGISVERPGTADTAGLLELSDPVRFRHPLVRSAAYRSASPHELRRIHSALADVTDPEVDPDSRAWHRAHAAPAPDETVALDLERSADRAQRRGGVAAAAAFLERAAQLTPDPAARGARALAAAQSKLEAAAPEAASELLAAAEHCPLDELERARSERLRAQISFAQRRGSDAPPLLVAAARRLAPLDPELARETYLEAVAAAIFAGRLGPGRGEPEAARAARAAPPAKDPPRPLDLLLEGLTARFTEGYVAGVPALERALQAFSRPGAGSPSDARWLWLACRVAPELWDDESWVGLAGRQLELARQAGALTILPIAAHYRAGCLVHAGELNAADALVAEADAISQATGIVALSSTALVSAAWRGDEPAVRELIRTGVEDARQRGEGRALTLGAYGCAVLYNAHGRYDEARAAAERATEHDDLGLLGWGLTELIEAAVRSLVPEAAAEALPRLAERTRACSSDWALGIEARSRALLSEGSAAEVLYQEAIERLGQSRIRIHLARAHLLYGEWLRRERRRVDARDQLRTAHELCVAMGLEAFAERAARELLATGETARRRAVETADRLTAQEAQIARLAREGLSNPEIGARLFISPRTVQYHLRKVFAKLDINSRGDLDGVLSADSDAVRAI